MSDIPCIFDTSLVSEKNQLKQDIIKGKALDILLILLSGSKTIREISRELSLPSFSVQLYIKRLVDSKLIKVIDTRVIDGKVEKTYDLSSTDIDILNHLKNTCKTEDSEENIELSAQHFASLTREIIRNIGSYKEKPHKIKAYFIKADEDKMKAFKKELDELFEKYQGLENLDAEETYGFISVLAPYKLKE